MGNISREVYIIVLKAQFLNLPRFNSLLSNYKLCDFDNFLISRGLSFLICKAQMKTVPTS